MQETRWKFTKIRIDIDKLVAKTQCYAFLFDILLSVTLKCVS
jgi:hypothetical protein